MLGDGGYLYAGWLVWAFYAFLCAIRGKQFQLLGMLHVLGFSLHNGRYPDWSRVIQRRKCE